MTVLQRGIPERTQVIPKYQTASDYGSSLSGGFPNGKHGETRGQQHMADTVSPGILQRGMPCHLPGTLPAPTPTCSRSFLMPARRTMPCLQTS